MFSVKLNPLRDGSNFGARVGALARCPTDAATKKPKLPGGRQALRLGGRAHADRRHDLLDRRDVRDFALWLATTSPSVFIQEHNAWTIPAIQSIHIVGIALVMGSVLMIDLRILGWAWADQTLQQTTRRFGPWLTGSLWLLLATGLLMVIGEPVRELVTFSFWLKMALVAIGALVAVRLPARRSAVTSGSGKTRLVHRRSIKALAIVTFLVWVCIIVLGRLIAYDHVWGSWSPAVGQ